MARDVATLEFTLDFYLGSVVSKSRGNNYAFFFMFESNILLMFFSFKPGKYSLKLRQVFIPFGLRHVLSHCKFPCHVMEKLLWSSDIEI